MKGKACSFGRAPGLAEVWPGSAPARAICRSRGANIRPSLEYLAGVVGHMETNPA